jgi:hypothetical protein
VNDHLRQFLTVGQRSFDETVQRASSAASASMLITSLPGFSVPLAQILPRVQNMDLAFSAITK